jgi:hypothetical protein
VTRKTTNPHDSHADPKAGDPKDRPVYPKPDGPGDKPGKPQERRRMFQLVKAVRITRPRPGDNLALQKLVNGIEDHWFLEVFVTLQADTAIVSAAIDYTATAGASVGMDFDLIGTVISPPGTLINVRILFDFGADADKMDLLASGLGGVCPPLTLTVVAQGTIFPNATTVAVVTPFTVA